MTREQVSIMAGYKVDAQRVSVRLTVAGYVRERARTRNRGLGISARTSGLCRRAMHYRSTGDGRSPTASGRCSGGCRRVLTRSIERQSPNERFKSTRNAYISRLNVRKIVTLTRDGVLAAGVVQLNQKRRSDRASGRTVGRGGW